MTSLGRTAVVTAALRVLTALALGTDGLASLVLSRRCLACACLPRRSCLGTDSLALSRLLTLPA